MREFLARESVTVEFEDVRKAPLSPAATVALVRKHKRAFAKRGPKLVELDPATATREEIEKYFLGREGTLRAPTMSDGETIIGGFDEATYRKMLLEKK